jgi:DeoR/GlpR family transcriptional regulator of sugar metabolism
MLKIETRRKEILNLIKEKRKVKISDLLDLMNEF